MDHTETSRAEAVADTDANSSRSIQLVQLGFIQLVQLSRRRINTNPMTVAITANAISGTTISKVVGASWDKA
jgi:hypothetical protein